MYITQTFMVLKLHFKIYGRSDNFWSAALFLSDSFECVNTKPCTCSYGDITRGRGAVKWRHRGASVERSGTAPAPFLLHPYRTPSPPKSASSAVHCLSSFCNRIHLRLIFLVRSSSMAPVRPITDPFRPITDDGEITTARSHITGYGTTYLEVVYTNDVATVNHVLQKYEQWLADEKHKFVGLDLEFTRETCRNDPNQRMAVIQIAFGQHVLVFHYCRYVYFRDCSYNRSMHDVILPHKLCNVLNASFDSKELCTYEFWNI